MSKAMIIIENDDGSQQVIVLPLLTNSIVNYVWKNDDNPGLEYIEMLNDPNRPDPIIEDFNIDFPYPLIDDDGFFMYQKFVEADNQEDKIEIPDRFE